MAVTPFPAITLDFTTKEAQETPAVLLEEGKTYQYFIQTLPFNTVLPNAYVNIIAKYATVSGIYESPLIAKFFPKGLEMVIHVPIPDKNVFKDTELSLLLLPNGYYRPNSSPGIQDFLVSWNDEKFNTSEVAFL